MSLAYPDFNPVALSLGPLHIRWYALAYLAGFILGWLYCLKESARDCRMANAPKPKDYDDFLTWAIFAVVLGGRVGYVLFYNMPLYMQKPAEIFEVWHGGMSFHGGLWGVVIATLIFCRWRKLPALAFGDLLAAAAPIGLCFGRIANFINGELYGHVTSLPWGMVFPTADSNPRHPSQLYEAALEGVLLFLALNVMARQVRIRQRPGMILGAFFAGYGLCRMLAEIWRAPDAQLGYLWGGLTMGQWQSVPMLLVGAALIWHALKKPPAPLAPESAAVAEPGENDDEPSTSAKARG